MACRARGGGRILISCLMLFSLLACSHRIQPADPIPDILYDSEPATIAGWRQTKMEQWVVWEHGNIVYVDRRGTGRPDWKIDRRYGDDNIFEKEDSRGTGWFDRRYHRGFTGTPDHLETIHEKVPATR